MRKTIGLLAVFMAMVPIFSLYSAAINQAEYPYYKKIAVPAGVSEPAIVNFDVQILDHMKPDGSDIRIMENNAEIPIKALITGVQELAHGGKIAEASSSRPDFRGISFGPNSLIDGDYSGNDNAYWQIDSQADPYFAYFTLELQGFSLSDRAKIWTLNPEYTWTDIQVEGSNDLNDWSIVKGKTPYAAAAERTVVFPPVQFKYLRFSFWHTQSLVINEIEVYGASSGKAVFFAKSGNDYRIYYGNRLAQAASYDTSSLSTKGSTPQLSPGFQQSNQEYSSDTDADGRIQDNCPTASNPAQEDSDNDGIGNACDNCPDSANSNQQDSDNDGIGDKCDNCPSLDNPDQFDDNLNGIGYACDDNDGDRVINSKDNCISSRNPAQGDKDRNGIGDACEDLDNDGIHFSKDNCLSIQNPDQKDSD